AKEENPDVIVIDMNFPNPTNLELLTTLKGEIKHPKILVLTETIEPKYIEQFHDSGVDMVFNKKDDLNKFIGHLDLLDDVDKETEIE
ncbi:MAG TPA: response regulator, partial [Bacteroidales bacterium]